MKHNAMRAPGRIAALMLAILIFLSLPAPAFADAGLSVSETAALRDETARYVYETTPEPGYDTMEGRWEVYSVHNSAFSAPQGWYDAFYQNVEDWVAGAQGVLHRRKYTEYSAMTIVLSSLGYDPANVAGYDLTAALEDFDNVVWQGVNGPTWALQALECVDSDSSVKQRYIEEILSRQLDCGAWNLNDRGGDGQGDIDLTGMALQALAAYPDQPAVKAVFAADLYGRVPVLRNGDLRKRRHGAARDGETWHRERRRAFREKREDRAGRPAGIPAAERRLPARSRRQHRPSGDGAGAPRDERRDLLRHPEGGYAGRYAVIERYAAEMDTVFGGEDG